MTRVLFILSLIFFEATIIGAHWYGSGMRSLRDRVRHRSGGHHDWGRRLRDDFCDELREHGPHEPEWDRDIRRVREEPEDRAFDDLAGFMDSLDRRFRGRSEEILRRIMRRWGIDPEPRMYKLLNVNVSQSVAKRMCESQGGQLAVIRSGEEQSLAWEAADKARKNKVFIGLRQSVDAYRIGEIHWHDGTPVRYRNLKRGHNYMQCGVLIVRTGKWNFQSCWSKFPALCEFLPNATTTTGTPRHPPRVTTTTTISPGRRSSRKTTTKRPVTTGRYWLPTRRVVTEIRLDVDFDTANSLPNFKSDLKKAIAALLSKPEKDIVLLGMRRGSTIVKVEVVLQPGETTETLLNKLHKAALKGGVLDAKFSGRTAGPELEPEEEPKPLSKVPKPDHKKIFIPVIVLLLVLIGIVVGLALFMIKRKRKIQQTQQRSAPYEEQPPPYKEFEASNYIRPPRVDSGAPPKYDECMETKKELHV